MKCQKCGGDNDDTSKFCKNCGASLETNSVESTTTNKTHKKIIIGLIIVIIAILAIGGLYGMGFFKGEIPLETKDFEAFTMDVPVGSKYVLIDSSSKNESNLFVGYRNKGEYEFDAFGFYIGNNVTKKAASVSGEFYEKDGKMEVYKNNSASGPAMYSVYQDNGDNQIVLLGSDLNTLKKMAKSVKDFDADKLSSDYTEPAASQTTAPTQTSSTPSSISILGGSFSTGSADADKTYARINVGTSHAGEDVIVQIYYSRDGNSLNNGNMVPATVHSDGYLEIASADAYKYYPDYATINIYDSNSNLLTTKSVSLSPSAGTQTF